MFEISRRDLVLSAAGAYAAFGLTSPDHASGMNKIALAVAQIVEIA